MLALAFLATVINYLSRQALSVSAPTLQKVFSLTNQDYGLITSGFFLMYTISNGISGPLIDRSGTKRGYLGCMLVWSTGIGLVAFAHNAWMLAGFMMLLGLGEAGNWPAAVKLVSEWFSPRERSFASGIFNSGSGVGALLGPPTIGLLLYRFGWRPAFLVVGGLGYLWMIVFGAVYRTPPRAEGEAKVRPPPPWKLFKTRFVLCFTLAKIFIDPVWYFYVFWLPKFLSDVYHLGIRDIAWLGSVPFVVGGLGNLAGGGLTQGLIAAGMEIPKARKLGAGAFGLLMTAAIPAIFTARPMVAVGFVSIAMFGYTGFLANSLAFPADVFPGNAVASIWGLASMGSGMGGMLFSWLSGRVIDRWGYFPVFIGYGIMPLIGLVLVLAGIGPLRRDSRFAGPGREEGNLT